MGRRNKFELEDVYRVLCASMKRVDIQAVRARSITIPPTIQELASALGGCSTRTVIRYLAVMEDRGWISRHMGARGIILLGRAKANKS